MSWIISHAISAVKSETPQVTASTVSPRALNACASKDQLYFVPPQSRARAARGASWVRCAPGLAIADRMRGRGRRRPGVVWCHCGYRRHQRHFVCLHLRGTPDHPDRRVGGVEYAERRHHLSSCPHTADPCRLLSSIDLRLQHVSPFCATRSALRIAVGGSCVFKASRHLVFRPVGVAPPASGKPQRGSAASG